jgi:hypothetical protein
MPVQSSFPSVAEQILTFNSNVVSLLSNINSLVSSTASSVTFNIIDQSGVSRQYSLPSFGYLQSEINRLNNNINSIYNIDGGGAQIQPTNANKFQKIVTIDLNLQPSDVSNIPVISNFTVKDNFFFDTLLDPSMSIIVDLTGKVPDNVRKVLIRRYIPKFSQDASGNFTPLGQAALNSFNSLFRNNNSFTLDDFLTWYQNTPGLVSPFEPSYEEKMVDLQPNQLQYDGKFSVTKIEEDTLNKKLWYWVDTLTYVENVFVNGIEQQQQKQLGVGDQIIINTDSSTTIYQILEISTSTSSPRLRFERIQGYQPIPVGIQTIKIYSPVLYDKMVSINIGYNERNALFVKALDMNNYILSNNWSTGVGYWTNDLKDISSGSTMEQFYTQYVDDYGKLLQDLVAKKTPTSLAGTPNVVNLVDTNFKVVQINKHLTDTPNSNLILNKHNQQKTLKSEVQQLNDAITDKNKELRVTRFTSDAARKQHVNEIDLLTKQRDSKSTLLSSVNSEILDISKSPVTSVPPVFHVRGFWSIPEPVYTRGTRPQQIVQFRVQYRYLSSDGKESPVETFKLADAPATATSSLKNGAFSNWIEVKTDTLKRTYDASNNQYTWETPDLSNPDLPNINQLDIPIQYNENVQIRIKSISEVGWPDSPVESDWSNTLTVNFPDSLNDVINQNDNIVQTANSEAVRINVTNDLSARGLDNLLSQQVTVNNKTFNLSTDTVLSGFYDDNGVATSLIDYLTSLTNRISALEDKITRAQGQLVVSIYRNSEQFVVQNGSELSFNVECEDYLDSYNAAGVPTGRVYQNNIYVVKDFLMKISNASTSSPLGLLSSRTYANNTDVYNSSIPQVFWVDPQNELIVDNSTGVSKTQLDNLFIWSVNYDSVNQTTVTKLGDNIGNNFTNPSINNNSITSVLSSNEFNLGYSENSILTFVGNNTSLLDPSKWIDPSISVASTTKLLTSIHPQVQGLDKVQETNSTKVHTINGGVQNDVNIPINIYFKMNSLDSNLTGLNYEYVNLNGSKTTVRHIKKLKFFLENEAENRPFVFTVKFTISRSKIAVNKTLTSTPTQLISTR